MKKENSSIERGRTLRITATLCGLVLILALSVLLAFLVDRRNTPADTPVHQTETQAQSAAPIPDTFTLGQGLVLTDVTVAAGIYPEDGGNDFLPEMLCITVRNESKRTLQISRVELTVNGEPYLFEFTSLPPGGTLLAYEMNRKHPPQSITTLDAECQFSVFYEEEPDTDSARLSITPVDGGLKVRNQTDEDIEEPFYVYYKSVQNGVYVGGITYRVRVEGLPAGEEASVYAAHATANYTSVIGVTYGNE